MKPPKSEPSDLTQSQQVTSQAGKFTRWLWPKLSKKNNPILKKRNDEGFIDNVSAPSDLNSYKYCM